MKKMINILKRKCYRKDPTQTRNKNDKMPGINLIWNVKELCEEKHKGLLKTLEELLIETDTMFVDKKTPLKNFPTSQVALQGVHATPI